MLSLETAYIILVVCGKIQRFKTEEQRDHAMSLYLAS